MSGCDCWSSLLVASSPAPLKDPKDGTSQNDPHYYIGETRVFLGGSICWILWGGLGRGRKTTRRNKWKMKLHLGVYREMLGLVWGLIFLFAVVPLGGLVGWLVGEPAT